VVHEARSARAGPSSSVAEYLQGLLGRHAGLEDGEVATYIPELARVDPSLFGICLATVDGAVYEAGETRAPFTVQSISKPLTYGLALERLGADVVRRRVGVEPSGDAFNELSLAPETGAPLNPLINAGAIVCAGLVAAATDPLALLLETYSLYAGRSLEIDEAVYRSESNTGHTNRAMAHMLRSSDVITGDPDEALDLYFRQCSVLVDCRDLATIAATLANGGLNPVTGERAVGEQVVRDVLSVMATCGMYNFAGGWLVSVGLPAKSGVSGGVLAVLPGRLGIGVFSPRLDAQGNSVRGIAVCEDLSRDLELHLVRPGERTPSPVRLAYTVAELGSKRVRSEAQRDAIRASASRTAVVELQGELGFNAGEALARSAEASAEPPELVVVDLRRIARADAGGIEILRTLAKRLEARGGLLALTRADGHALQGLSDEPVLVFDELDHALEWCEEELLVRAGCSPLATTTALVDHELLAGFSADEIDRIVPELGTVAAVAGTRLVRSGDLATELFLVMRGTLSVVASSNGRRLTTLSAGMTFGELAFVDRGERSADVCADSAVVCRTLAYARLDALADSDPILHGKLLRNILRVVVGTLRGVNAEVEHLAR
jgi:glutaminase